MSIEGESVLKELTEKIIKKENLSALTMQRAVKEIMTGEHPVQISDFLMQLKAKGETPEEIYGTVVAMKTLMVRVVVPYPVLDIVGTGGDGLNTINISTGSALLAASCGVKVAKHGNRSVSSHCGSADVLESLGVRLNVSPADVVNSIEKYNFGFFYATLFHPAFEKVHLIRKHLGVPTIFNLIGPLLNPASAQFLMMGVSDQKYLKQMAEVLLQLRLERALIFHCQGLDEISTVGPITICEVNQSKRQSFILDPKKYGFKPCSIESLQGGAPETNAKMLRHSLKGEQGPISDTLILNAGIACYVYGLCDSIEEGIVLAGEKQAEGRADRLLQTMVSDRADA